MASRDFSSDPGASAPGGSSSSRQNQAFSPRSLHGDQRYQHRPPWPYDADCYSTQTPVVTSNTDVGGNSHVNPWSDGASAHASNFARMHSVTQIPTGSNDLWSQPTQQQYIGVPAPQDIDPRILMPPPQRPQRQMHVAHRTAASGRVPQSRAWGDQFSYPYDGRGMSASTSGPAHSPTQPSTPMPFVLNTPPPTGAMSLHSQLPRLTQLSEAGMRPAGSGNTLTRQIVTSHSIVQEESNSQTPRAPQFMDHTDQRGNTSKCPKCHCPQPQDRGDGGPVTCVTCDACLR